MKRRLWLSRQRDGNFMLTLYRPKKHKIGATQIEDFYIEHGEPIGVRYLCPVGVKYVFGVTIDIGEQVQIWVDGNILDES